MKDIEMKELRQVYKHIFESEAGKRLYWDLQRIANQNKINSDSPDPYACVYKVAQQALLKRIDNMLERERPNTQKITEGNRK